ncbi:MAG TPA: YihY/virulence factor BrkB family protein [Candidatus Binataceae bacterium]|nr:YihY/virulence factor BrkB family protein [Candidatus Binataceae bacterium]
MDFSYQLSDYRRQATTKLRVLADPVHLAIRLATVLRVAVVNFVNNNDLLWASALTYTMTLSIVPILALAFSVLKGLGGTERMQPLIERYLALGNSQTAGDLMHLVGNVNAATLGSVGGAALLLTVISTLGTIESAFNTIWQVPAGRSYLRKFTDYLSVVFTIPLLLVAALTLTASFSSRFHNWHSLSLVLPSLILWIGFFFLFIFFPYTRVRWTAAALGSLVTAVLFQFAQWAYVHFWVGMSSYKAIYGALATLPVLLLWIYLGWAIVLFGVEVSFAAQRGTSRYEVLPRSLNFTRYAALLTLLRLAERFHDKHLTVTAETLASELRVPPAELTPLIENLKQIGLVIETSYEHAGRVGLFLSLDPASVKLGEAFHGLEMDSWGDPRIADLLGCLREVETRHLDSVTLQDLSQGGEVFLSRIMAAATPDRDRS